MIRLRDSVELPDGRRTSDIRANTGDLAYVLTELEGRWYRVELNKEHAQFYSLNACRSLEVPPSMIAFVAYEVG